jgi:hypothetical protein
MTQVVIAAVLIVVAVVIAAVLRRGRVEDAPTQVDWRVPQQPRPPAVSPGPTRRGWSAVFSSASCDSWRRRRPQGRGVDCADVAVDVAEVAARPDVHRQYHIDAVPLVVVADADGVVRAGFLGPVTATDLWAAVAEARAPGSTPEPGLGRS